MMTEYCKACGKPPLGWHAGSITSYFFEHKYCRCSRGVRKDSRLVEKKPANLICSHCGMAQSESKRIGSFTSFLFKELRCQCIGSRSRQESNSNTQRTTTRTRSSNKKLLLPAVGGSASPLPSNRVKPIVAGSIIGNTFKIRSVVGMGGMGTVYDAEHLTLKRPFALKVLTADLVDEQSWLRFQSEAKILASLNHESFVSVYDLGIHDGSVPFYSMDLLRGRNLEDLLAEDGPQKLDTTLEIFMDVLSAMSYAHRNGIIHRDLKPANIFLCSPGQHERDHSEIKILDFGISKLIRNGKQPQNLTAMGEIFGSYYYMSPEQGSGDIVDERSDIYSIGCSIFETLTGFVPFEGRNAIETAMMHQETEPPLLSELMPNVFPSSISDVIDKCLAKLPRDRYQSAKELSLDLGRIRHGEKALATTQPFRRSPAARREKSYSISPSILISLGLTLLITLLASGGAIWWSNQKIAEKSVGLVIPKNTDAEIELNQDPLDASVSGDRRTLKDFIDSHPSFCSHIKGKNGEAIRRFTFPIEKLGLGYLRADNGPYLKAAGTVDVPVKRKVFLYFLCAATPYPQIYGKFGDNDFNGIELVTASVPQVVAILKEHHSLEHLSFFNSISHTPGLDGSDLLQEHLPLIDQLTQLHSLGINGSMYSGKPLHGHEVLAEGIAKMKLMNTLSALQVQEIDDVKALLKAVPLHPNLTELSVSRSGLADNDLKLLAAANNLQVLKIYQCPKISPASAEILKKLPGLKLLVIDSNWPEADKIKFKKIVPSYIFEDYRKSSHN